MSSVNAEGDDGGGLEAPLLQETFDAHASDIIRQYRANSEARAKRGVNASQRRRVHFDDALSTDGEDSDLALPPEPREILDANAASVAAISGGMMGTDLAIQVLGASSAYHDLAQSRSAGVPPPRQSGNRAARDTRVKSLKFFPPTDLDDGSCCNCHGTCIRHTGSVLLLVTVVVLFPVILPVFLVMGLPVALCAGKLSWDWTTGRYVAGAFFSWPVTVAAVVSPILYFGGWAETISIPEALNATLVYPFLLVSLIPFVYMRRDQLSRALAYDDLDDDNDNDPVSAAAADGTVVGSGGPSEAMSLSAMATSNGGLGWGSGGTSSLGQTMRRTNPYMRRAPREFLRAIEHKANVVSQVWYNAMSLVLSVVVALVIAFLGIVYRSVSDHIRGPVAGGSAGSSSSSVTTAASIATEAVLASLGLSSGANLGGTAHVVASRLSWADKVVLAGHVYTSVVILLPVVFVAFRIVATYWQYGRELRELDRFINPSATGKWLKFRESTGEGVVTELTYKIDTLERFFFVYFVRERVGRHTLSSIFFDGAVSVTLLATLYLMLSFAISLICLVGPDSTITETFAYAVIASITTSTYLISLVLFAISVHTRKEAIVTTLKATATEMNSKAIQRRMEENSYHNFNFGDSSNVVRRRRTSTGGSGSGSVGGSAGGSGSVGEVGGPVDQATESQRLEALVTLMNVDIQNYKVESLKLLGVEMNTSVRNTLFGLASTAVTFLVSSGISYYQDIKNS